MIAKILLADDDELARAAIKLLLSDRTDLKIIAEAADGEEAVEKAKIECPDVAIVDISMPRMNGIQAAMEILRGDHSVLSHEVRRYSRDSLRRLVTEAGFETVRLTHTNQTLFLPMLAVRAVHRWRGLAAETDAQQEIRVPPAPINGCLSALLFAESLWVRAFDGRFGSSLLCLARKPARPAKAGHHRMRT